MRVLKFKKYFVLSLVVSVCCGSSSFSQGTPTLRFETEYPANPTGGTPNSGINVFGNPYSTPKTNNEEYNRALQEIRRNGASEAFKKITSEIGKNDPHKDAGYSKDFSGNFKYFTDQLKTAASQTSFLSVGQVLPPTKIPVGASESLLKKDLDPLWNTVDPTKFEGAFADPEKVAAEINRINGKIASYHGANLTQYSDYLKSELHRNFVNSEGVMEFPGDTPLPTHFQSSWDRESGAMVRSAMNDVRVTLHLYGQFCGGKNSDSASCESFRNQVGELEFGLQLADQLSFVGKDQQAKVLIQSLVATGYSLRSLAVGVVKGTLNLAKETVEGGIYLATHFGEVTRAAALALSDLPGTFKVIKGLAQEKWQAILEAPPSEQFEMIGELVPQVVGAMFGASEAAKSLQALKVLPSAIREASLASALQMASSEAISQGLLVSGSKIESAFGKIASNAPEFGQTFIRGAHFEPNASELKLLEDFTISSNRLQDAQAAFTGLREEGIVGSRSNQSFHLRALENESRGFLLENQYSDLHFSMAEYQRLENLITPDLGVPFHDVVWRAVPERVTLTDGKVIINTEASVFDSHAGMWNSNGRYNQVGEFTKYVTTSKNPVEAWATAAEEIGTQANQPFVLASKEYSLSRILDLTDPKIRNFLGLSEADLFSKKNLIDQRPYLRSQAIGNILRSKGFQGVKYISSQEDAIGPAMGIFVD